MPALFVDTPEIADLRAQYTAADVRLSNITTQLTAARRSISKDHGDPLGSAISAAIAAGDDARVSQLRTERANAERDCTELPMAVNIAAKVRDEASRALARAELVELRPALVNSRTTLTGAVEALREAVRSYITARRAYQSAYGRCDFPNGADRANADRAENVAPLSGLVGELFVKLRDYI